MTGATDRNQGSNVMMSRVEGLSLALRVAVSVALTLYGASAVAHAQNARPPARPTPAPASAQSEPLDEAAERQAIFDSDCWRRAMFELNEWCRTQTVFTPAEASRMRADFNSRVQSMSNQELRELVKDIDAKFRLLDSPEVRETRAWFAQYMAVLSDRKRAEVLREIPDFPTMTAAQLQQAILKIQRKKSAQANFNQGRQVQVNAQLQANQANQAALAAARTRTAQRPAYRSPYRPAPQGRPFDDVQIGPQTTWIVDPLGGMWRTLNF
jgi:hypothetical protein